MLVDLSKIKPDSTVAVAVSGGCDSMVLLHYLNKASAKKGFSVIAINVEHGIRGKESEKDSEFVADYCKKNSIPVLSYKINCPEKAAKEKLSLEEAARLLRYDCFKKALKDGKCDYVATAHHLRDNAESVLFNLFRGTGVKGLSGIRDTDDGKIIRPLVKTPKEDIEAYAEENGLPFVTDSSNLSEEFTRNYIRLNILPKIKKVFPEAEKNVARLSDIAYEQSEYLRKQAAKILSVTHDGAEISLPADETVLREAVILALKSCGIEKDWEKVHTDDVISLTKKQTGKRITLPQGVEAKRIYDKIVFMKKRDTLSAPETERFGKQLKFSEGEFGFCGNKLTIARAEPTADLKSGLYLDADKLPRDAVIRTPETGDVFVKFGGGTKRLKEYLTDKKISADERKTTPVIAKGNVIYAIFGVAVSEDVKADETTERLIKITKV